MPSRIRGKHFHWFATSLVFRHDLERRHCCRTAKPLIGRRSQGWILMSTFQFPVPSGKKVPKTRNTDTMTFREPLPDSCPPANTTHPTDDVLWRMLMAPQVSDADFDSQAEKQKGRKFKNECEGRSVSLVTTLEACRAAVKSPRVPPFTHAVPVNVDVNAGVWHQDKVTHVHWWPYATSLPLSLVAGAAVELK